MHAKFFDFTRMDAAEFRDVEYFVERYVGFLSLTPQQLNVLHDNEGAEEVKQPFIHVDKIWAFLAKKKLLDGCRLRFENLAKVAIGIEVDNSV